MRTSLRTIPLADQFASDSVITLDQIRTVPRRTNDYVDSPRALATPPIKPHHLASHSHHHHHVEGGGGGGGGVSPGFAHRLLPSRTGGSVVAGGRVVVGGGGLGGGIGEGGGGRSALLAPSTVVSHQPVSKPCPLKKNVDSLDDNNGGGGVHTHGGIGSGDNGLSGEDLFAEAGHGEEGGGGIICDKCHRCKCNDCTDTKPLPSHWCCGNVYEVSPEKVLDDCTCFCCVKCTMYHCGNEEDYENPCGCCSTPHCMRRWTFMTVVALCLPCLWAYWPARGCLSACTTVYNRCWWGKKGCNCQCNNNIVKLDSDTTNKRSVLSRGSGGGGSGGTSGGGGGGTKNSQSRRLLIDRDSSSTST